MATFVVSLALCLSLCWSVAWLIQYWLLCAIAGHRLYSPGDWERGWWSQAKKAWQHYSLCECDRCKGVFNDRFTRNFT